MDRDLDLENVNDICHNPDMLLDNHCSLEDHQHTHSVALHGVEDTQHIGSCLCSGRADDIHLLVRTDGAADDHRIQYSVCCHLRSRNGHVALVEDVGNRLELGEVARDRVDTDMHLLEQILESALEDSADPPAACIPMEDNHLQEHHHARLAKMVVDQKLHQRCPQEPRIRFQAQVGIELFW